MNFSQLQCFVALAETGSFTEAAYAIDLTQSAVSHALSALERELGVTLLERNNKGVVALTGIGQTLLPHARALLAQAETIQQEARAARGLIKGNFRLGCISPASDSRVARLLAHFHQQYPDITVVLFEGTTHEIEEWLHIEAVDVGLVQHPSEGMESFPFTTDELHVFMANGHRLHARTSVTTNDLRDESWVMRSTGCDLPEIFEHYDEKYHPDIRYRAGDGATMLAMVREGLGITLLPRKMIPDKLEGITSIPLDPPRRLQIGLGFKSQAALSPAAALFVHTAFAWVQEQAAQQQDVR